MPDQSVGPLGNRLMSACFLLCSLTLSAQTVTVGCAGAGGGPFDFATLSDALAAPNVSDILVSGTCNETNSLSVTGRQLNITGTPGATISSPSGSGSLGSKSPLLRVQNLTLDNWMVSAGEGNIEVTNCVLRHSNHALEIWKQAMITLTGTTIEDASVGISIRQGGFAFLNGSNTIRNSQVGISVDGGAAWLVWSNEISGNQYGMRLLNGASASVDGPLVLANNSFGVALTGSSIKFTQQEGSPILRNNGVSGDSNTAAILAEGNSHVDIFDSQVINNRSHAIILRDNATARAANTLITGNAGNGIRLLTLSSAHLYGGMTISGNGGGDLVCSINSFASGYRSGIGRMACLTFTPSSETPLWW